MRLPDGDGLTVRTAGAADVDTLNQLFSDAFTDRYHRDGLVGVRVPQLNPAVWDYAIRDAGQGAMLWFDDDGEMVAFNMVHASGAEGWMGPLAVRPDRQETGIGRTIVLAGVEWLERQGATVIGLETMPRTVDNIGFYSRLGFRPHHLTVTLTGAAQVRGGEDCRRLSALSATERVHAVESAAACLQRVAPGFDYRREMSLTESLGLGDTVLLERDGNVEGFAVCHHAALAVGRRSEELRILKLFVPTLDAFRHLMQGVEALAVAAKVGHVAIRCQTAFADAYRALIGADYRVRWTDLRMTLGDRAEPMYPDGAILLSNWEI